MKMIFSFLALDPIALKIGPIEVHWYGVIIASAVLLAVYLFISEAKRLGLNTDLLYDGILWSIPIAIISARIYYVIFQWGYYSNHLSEIPAIWDGGIAIYGALIGALLFIIWFCHHYHLSVWEILDIAAPTVILAQGIGRWGNFMNQEAFGAVTSLAFLRHLHLPEFIINQMYIRGFYRQPTFLYESAWDICGFAILVTMRHAPKLFKRGDIFLSYVMWYSFGRFFTEGMRTDSLMLFGGIRVSQLLSVILFFGALIIFLYRRHVDKLKWYYN